MTQDDVLAVLKEHGELTADEISERSGIPTYTIYNNLSKLRRKRDIENVPIEDRKKGGPQFKYRLKGG